MCCVCLVPHNDATWCPQAPAMTVRAAWVCLVLVVCVVVGTGEGVGEVGNDGVGVEHEIALDEDYPGGYQDYPVDNHYGDESYSEYLPDLKNMTLRKCRCNGEQYSDDDGKCHNATSTYVFVVNPYHGEHQAAATSDLGNVKVEPLTCPPNHHLVTLDSNLGHYFPLLVSGGLVWEAQLFQEYCFVHTLDTSTGRPEAFQANICIPPLPIPHCCPPQHALLPDGNCSKDNNVPTLTPPVSVYGMEVVWQSEGEVESPVAPVSCPGKETLELGLVDRVSLMYSPHGLLLHWLPPMHHQPNLTFNFCLGVSTDHEYRARVCFSDPMAEHREKCRGVTCVRKCCQEGHKFEGIQCVPVVDNETISWHPEFYEKGSLKPGASPPSDLTIIHGMPLCSSFFMLEAHKSDEDRYYLQVDGTLHVPNFQRDFPAENYCLENFDTENDTALLPLICFEDQDRCTDVHNQAYPVLLGFSCIFLAITLLVYVSVPELHAKVHGKCLVSHVSALLLAYLSLIILKRTADTMPDVACKVMASIAHVSFLAAFFWLNVMCFDIWWTLKSMRPVAETGERSRLRFKMYSVYSWGCPLLISLVAIVVEYLPEDYDVIRPGFGDTMCWFENRQSLWAFFYGFVLVLVVLNIVFFCWVAWILIMAQNDPILQRTRQQNRERMWLYVKLFLVMGLTWITEVISWQERTCEAWIATDIINTLQGFSIFLIFICKRNMIKRIRTNWEPYLRRVKELFGPSRPPPSTRQAVHDTSSFSSSVHRPSQSNASQRTVQSQISLDPTTASRKLSTTSLGSLAGAPVHATSSMGSTGTPLTFSNSLSMDTITEATHQEAEEEEAAMQNQTEAAQKQGQQGEQKQEQQGEQKQGQGEQKQRQVEQEQEQGEQKQGQGEQNQGMVEDEKQDIEKKQPSQEIDRLSPASLKVSEPRTNDMTTEQMSPEEGSNHNTSNRIQTHPQGDTPHDTENTRLSGRVSPSQVEIDMPSDSPGQQEIDTQLRAPTSRDRMVNGALKASDEMVPIKTIEDRVSPSSNDNLEGNIDTVITPTPAGEDAIGSKGAPVECYNRAFTTDDDDDLPIEV